MCDDVLAPVKAMWEPGRYTEPAIGPGWHPLLLELTETLSKVDPTVRYTFIKQKCGGLSVFVGHGNDAASDAIAEAEAKSLSICELCGEPGSLLARQGWYRTLCPGCAAWGGYARPPAWGDDE
ncbi:MAG: hypothetical protein KDB70_04920 [Mycobacterium sp.]|nr:hypothetical protein [Mycobacterium sp.]